jgi:hypothetical protein
MKKVVLIFSALFLLSTSVKAISIRDYEAMSDTNQTGYLVSLEIKCEDALTAAGKKDMADKLDDLVDPGNLDEELFEYINKIQNAQVTQFEQAFAFVLIKNNIDVPKNLMTLMDDFKPTYIDKLKIVYHYFTTGIRGVNRSTRSYDTIHVNHPEQYRIIILVLVAKSSSAKNIIKASNYTLYTPTDMWTKCMALAKVDESNNVTPTTFYLGKGDKKSIEVSGKEPAFALAFVVKNTATSISLFRKDSIASTVKLTRRTYSVYVIGSSQTAAKTDQLANVLEKTGSYKVFVAHNLNKDVKGVHVKFVSSVENHLTIIKYLPLKVETEPMNVVSASDFMIWMGHQ